MPVTELVAAAEETWGMMIFLENCLLFKDASIFNMESITKTVSHEIAHQVRTFFNLQSHQGNIFCVIFYNFFF